MKKKKEILRHITYGHIVEDLRDTLLLHYQKKKLLHYSNNKTTPTSQFTFTWKKLSLPFPNSSYISNSLTISMSTLCMASESDSATEKMKEGMVLEEGYVFKEEIHLTVLKTSLFFTGDGFTVYDCKGRVIFRVDSYGPDARDTDELVLMDPNGRCLLTVRRKVRSTHATTPHHYLPYQFFSSSSVLSVSSSLSRYPNPLSLSPSKIN